MDIRCSRDGTKCDGCPIMEECEKVELTEEVDLFKIYNKALDDCCNVLRQCWLNGTVANRIIKEQISEIEKLKK